jgi:hypothetical protein
VGVSERVGGTTPGHKQASVSDAECQPLPGDRTSPTPSGSVWTRAAALTNLSLTSTATPCSPHGSPTINGRCTAPNNPPGSLIKEHERLHVIPPSCRALVARKGGKRGDDLEHRGMTTSHRSSSSSAPSGYANCELDRGYRKGRPKTHGTSMAHPPSSDAVRLHPLAHPWHTARRA